jgi:hypothetical protein
LALIGFVSGQNWLSDWLPLSRFSFREKVFLNVRTQQVTQNKAPARTRLDENRLKPIKQYNRFTLSLPPYRKSAIAVALSSLAILLGFGRTFHETTKSERPLALPVSIEPDRIAADGYETATVFIKSRSPERPLISFQGNSRGAAIEGFEGTPGDWRARIHAGILPGRIELRIESPGYQEASARVTAVLDARDSAGDGTPDFLRLDDARDQQAFRSWFVWLAEAQYFQPPAARPVEIDDCAALIRFAYREALRAHDSAWANSAGLPEFPAFESESKYRYPFTPLGAALFRVKPGPFRAEDLSDLNGAKFLQFADAQTLRRFNTHLVGRDLARARPGDLLFFRRETNPTTFHAMIYVGESKVKPDGHRYLLYHTGPTGSDPGEIRRPTVDEMLRFPQPEWRPIAANPAFLGVMRWNILRGSGTE